MKINIMPLNKPWSNQASAAQLNETMWFLLNSKNPLGANNIHTRRIRLASKPPNSSYIACFWRALARTSLILRGLDSKGDGVVTAKTYFGLGLEISTLMWGVIGWEAVGSDGLGGEEMDNAQVVVRMKPYDVNNCRYELFKDILLVVLCSHCMHKRTGRLQGWIHAWLQTLWRLLWL